jgi:type II secretory pathway pseudopilin PulG
MNLNDKKRNESGFSYLDVMVGMVILLIGITALVSAITAAVMRSRETQQQLNAKQLASSTLESIFSARDIARDGTIDSWPTVGNVGSNLNASGVPQGIFMTGFRPIREDAGADGVVGTADDACNAPGNCQVGTNPANTSPVIQNFTRQIIITDINDPERPSPPLGSWPIMMRRVEIVIKYDGAGGMREERVSTIVSKY